MKEAEGMGRCNQRPWVELLLWEHKENLEGWPGCGTICPRTLLIAITNVVYVSISGYILLLQYIGFLFYFDFSFVGHVSH